MSNENPAEVKKITPELVHRLRDLYEQYRPKIESSPYLGCYDMSTIVGQEFGLQTVEGYFRIENGSRIEEIPHAWNEDADGVIIDFTKHQFNFKVPPEEKISLEVLPIIYPGENEYRRYSLKKL